MGVMPENWDKEMAASGRLGPENSVPSIPWADHAAHWRGPLVDSMVTWAVPMEYVVKIKRKQFWRGEFALSGMNAMQIPESLTRERRY